MAVDRVEILRTTQLAIQEQNRELEAARERQMQAVVSQTSTGSADINATFGLDRNYRLVYLRCHFVGTPGTAVLTLSVDSASGSAYDTRLFTITRAGTNRDVHFRLTSEERREPSPWAFQSGDQVRLEWTNPDSGNITWGLEVGLAIAS